MTGFIAEMTNYLIPASGAPRCFKFEQNMVAERNYQVDFRQITSEQGKAFRPYGMFIDNTRGTGRLEFLIQGLNFAGFVEPGQFFMTPYPAPMQQEITLRGNGLAVVLFVDFPVMPYSSAQLTGGSSGGGGDLAPVLSAIGERVSQATFTAAMAEILEALNAPGSGGGDGVSQASFDATMAQVLGALGGVIGAINTRLSQPDYAAGVSDIVNAIYSINLSPINNALSMQVNTYQFEGEMTSLKMAIADLKSAGAMYDSEARELPDNFNSLPRSYVYNAAGKRTQEVRTDGALYTWTKTFSYTDDNLTAESAWVRASI